MSQLDSQEFSQSCSLQGNDSVVIVSQQTTQQQEVNNIEIETAPLKEGVEMLRSLERDPSGIPPYMASNVDKCMEGINKICSTTIKLIHARRAGQIPTDEHTTTKIKLLKSAGETLKRYIVVYHHERMDRIRRITRQTCGLLSPVIRNNMAPMELRFAEDYYKAYVGLENDLGDGSLKLLTNNEPPTQEFQYFRCREDYGEYELKDGRVIMIKKGLILHMVKDNAETLLRTGVIERVHV